MGWPKLLGRHWEYWVLGLVLALGVGLRLHLLDVSLERDEGEYAYAGQLLLQGVPPYELAHNMKLPGIYMVYAIVMAVFGETARGIHLGLLVANACTTGFIFLVGRRLSGPVAGLVAAGCFSVLSSTYAVQGVFANAEHFVILPALAGVWLLLLARSGRRSSQFFWSGLLLGTGFVIKQHGIAFVAFGAVVLAIDAARMGGLRNRRWGRGFALLALGAFLPYAAIVLALYLAGTLENFWFWTVHYAMEYGGLTSIETGWRLFRLRGGNIYEATPMLWWLSALGLVLLPWNRRAVSHRLTLLLLCIFSVMSICPGLYFRPHYFVMLLPAASLLAGSAIETLAGLLSAERVRAVRYVIPVAIALLFVGGSAWEQREFNLKASLFLASRVAFDLNPFPEAEQIGEYLRRNSGEGDRIAVVGSEPELYFYARRRSATRYLYTYPLMETQVYAGKMQREMIQEIEAAAPAFLVFVNMRSSWLLNDRSDLAIMEWFHRYQKSSYDQVGLVEIELLHSAFHWAPAELPSPPRTLNWISIFKRRATAAERDSRIEHD
jgi:hypothetical protein